MPRDMTKLKIWDERVATNKHHKYVVVVVVVVVNPLLHVHEGTT